VAKFPNAIVAVLGIGRIGDGGALELLLRFGRENPGYHLRALRELSPFLAESDLAVLHRANQSDAPEALQRIAQGFEGNFQFINLVQAVTAAALRGASEPGAERHTGARRSGTARPSEQDYGALVERVKVAVRDAVPAGASVLVVSKGDDALLKLDGRRASHFPQSDKGTYAGHHPADDEAAVEQLEALRGTGAEYLVLPATSVWWLEHYNGFRRHLENTAAVRVCRPDTCIVFALGGASVEAAARSKRAAGPVVPYPRLVELVRQAVARDVPADATVAVVGKGDSQLIDLPGRRGVHFPQTAEGIYSGHHPADSAAAIEQLNAARARGAEYLLFPATAFWWLDHYAELRRHLDERHRLVRDDETCVLYRLAGTARRRSAWSWLGRPGQLLDEWGRRLQGPADVRRKGHGRPEREAERESDGPVPGRNDAP
jgi:hypothetical protein